MDAAGKKIFILYPHSVIQNEMLDILIMNGYESYVLHDHKKAHRLLERFPDSIMFINIDEGLKEKEWEAYIKEIQENEKTKTIQLGILSYNNDRQLMEKYLMDMAVPCGYIQLKLGVQASTKIMLDALQANEARGRRKFIRAECEDDSSATMNYKGDEGIHYGKLLDISSAGMAAKIEKFGAYPTNAKLKNIQLKLRGSLVMVNAILMGSRQGDSNVWIFLFEPGMSSDNKLIIHRFIKYCLQRFIDNLKI
jgi:ribonucleotide reductase beta subunit family protein with ferritin-like domain